MSDLFMDMQRRRHRWQNEQNTPPTSTSTASASTATTTTANSESPSSTQQHVNDEIFSHHSKNSSTAGKNTERSANHNFNIQNDNKIYKYDDDDDDAFGNILSLKLKKPKHWKWELSTSKSCSNIALPRILLYDHKGKLLVDAQGDNEGVYKQENRHKTKCDKLKKRSHQAKPIQTEYRQRAATANLTHSISQALEKEFNGLQIQEATPSPQPCSPISVSSRCSRQAIDFSTNDLPEFGISRRSSSLKGVRFNVDKGHVEQVNESHVPEFLPTPPSTTTPTTNSSSSGSREKRKYRRSYSSSRSSAHSESILERFSYQRGRFSSPEYPEEITYQPGPRYFLRSCKAGTLVIKEDSFNQHPRRRRRPLKNHSSESLQSVKKSPFSNMLHKQKLSSCKSPTQSDINCKSKRQPFNRHLTERNALIYKQLSTSEEDIKNSVVRKPFIDNVSEQHLQKSSPAQNPTKGLNITSDAHKNGKVR